MKLNHIAFAIAGMSFSLLANALTPTEIEAARSAGTLQQAWISGATAPTKTIYEAWSRGCNQIRAKSIYTTIGALDRNNNPTSNVPGSLGNYVAYACTRGTTPSVLYVTLDGGSLNAYTPHTINSKLARIRYAGTAFGTTNGCAAAVNSYADASDTRNNATVYKQCKKVGNDLPATGATAETNAANQAAVATDANAPQLPVGGFSDVEAALFSPSIGGGSLSGKGTEANAGLLQGFGVAVSVPLYRKLQEVQGITEADDAVANAPSLTKSQITSILQNDGALSAAQSWTPILGADYTGTESVIVQRRVDTSGTQASSNAFFMGNPCLGSTNQLTPAAATSGAYQVVLNSGSSNVKANITTATTNNQFAIGVLSLENDFRVESAANGGYRYIKIDGVHPEEGDTTNARVAMASGKYPFAMELKSFVSNNPAFSGPSNTLARGIVNTLSNALKNPAAAQCAFLPRGISLTADGGNTSCEAGDTRAVLTKFGKNCAPAVLFE